MSNTPIAQIAASTIKGTEKQNVYPKTIDKAVLTTDKEGNEVTLDNVLIRGIDINGETVTPDENGVVDISAAVIESIDTEESQEDGGNNVVTITMTNEDEYTFNIKNGTKGSDGAPGATGPQGPAGPKGDQGNSGYSGAAGELEIVNNLTEGGEESALSAEMGKVLNEKAAAADGDEIKFGGVEYADVDISGISTYHMVRKWVSGTLSTKTDNATTCIFVPVTAGEVYKITATPRPDTPIALGTTAQNYSAQAEDILIDVAAETTTQEITIPEGKTYLQLQYANNTLTLLKKVGDGLKTYTTAYIDELAATLEEDAAQSGIPQINWYVPSIVYAIVGVEKSIYLNNVAGGSDYCNFFSIYASCSVGRIDTRRWYYTPITAGDISLTLQAFDYRNNLVSTKTITIKVLPATLPATTKNIVCIGDSITQICNMPKSIKECLATLTGIQPNFVGTQGDDDCHHEGYYGRSYNWLVTNASSPFVNNGTVDIQNWLNNVGVNKIDVVSLAMGVNDANDEWSTVDGINRMKTLINAFKAINGDTRFIVHLIDFVAMGYVDTPANFAPQNHKKYEQLFRQLCIDEYDGGSDANIIIGDLGLVYDRFFAHIRSEKHPAPDYTDDTCNIVVDILHPNAKGSRQMGYGIAPSILKMLQD